MSPVMPVSSFVVTILKTCPNRSTATRYTQLSRQLKNVSIKDVEEWEKKMMEDPKVRYIRRIIFLHS